MDEAVVHMPSLSVHEQRDVQLADPAIARLRNLLDDPPTSPRALRGETREVLTMMHDAQSSTSSKTCCIRNKLSPSSKYAGWSCPGGALRPGSRGVPSSDKIFLAQDGGGHPGIL